MTAVIDVVSLFPDTVRAVLDSSILRRAQAQGRVRLEASDLRAFAEGRHRAVDDTPFGGRQGMLFTAPVLERACAAQLAAVDGDRERLKVLYPSPRGMRLGQPVFEAFADWMAGEDIPGDPANPEAEMPERRVMILCGRYEGVDERFLARWVDLEFTLGDFILTGGELPALVFTDALVRLLPGVLGDDRSAKEESFSHGLLEHPQFTKPREFQGLSVPEVLLGGNHSDIESWKLRESILLTAAFRPDLIRAHRGQGLPSWARELLERTQRRLDLRA
jgi:tRNA (guanine37-N1)-methyltransferase